MVMLPGVAVPASREPQMRVLEALVSEVEHQEEVLVGYARALQGQCSSSRASCASSGSVSCPSSITRLTCGRWRRRGSGHVRRCGGAGACAGVGAVAAEPRRFLWLVLHWPPLADVGHRPRRPRHRAAQVRLPQPVHRRGAVGRAAGRAARPEVALARPPHREPPPARCAGSAADAAFPSHAAAPCSFRARRTRCVTNWSAAASWLKPFWRAASGFLRGQCVR